MRVDKITEPGAVTFTVALTQEEAVRLAYGPLGNGEEDLGHTVSTLLKGLVEAIAAPACFQPTDEVLEDLPPAGQENG